MSYTLVRSANHSKVLFLSYESETSPKLSHQGRGKLQIHPLRLFLHEQETQAALSPMKTAHLHSELPKKLTLNKLALIGEAEKSP